MDFKTIDDVDLSGKRVFVRCDLNVPLEQEAANKYSVADDTRVRASVPTIKKLLAQGCTPLVASHLGRPKGERNLAFSLRPVASVLEKLLEAKVHFAEDCVGAPVGAALSEANPGEAVLLENTRFYAGETENDPAFAADLARPADAYVNDAFGTCHRKHASTYGAAELLNPAVAGYLVTEEVGYFLKLLRDPARPLIFVLGGAKLSTKLGVIKNALDNVDKFIVGGAMAYTFLKADGEPVGESMVEDDFVSEAKAILDDAGPKLFLPRDHVVAKAVDDPGSATTVDTRDISIGYMGVDIGPATACIFADEVKGAATIFWNGPMGVFEVEEFAGGTRVVGQAIADAEGETIAGGGDTVYAINKLGIAEKLDHISTGGGASLKLLEKGTLPCLEVLDRT
ncbi:MAG: phosphoglycerate kinase [Candidatus Coatesbacteria bacterium]|nr:MAG: phosphoglycerate kinase [Candidatus Coatesbacteria bacterium]